MAKLKDTKVNVTPEMAKIIGETIAREIKESRVKNKDMYERAKRCENQYNQVTRWMEEGKICDSPWQGAADYFVPMTEWVVDAIWSRIVNTLFSQEPYMTAVGTESADKQKEKGVTEFVDMAFREMINLYDNATFFFKQMIKLPGAIIKYDRVVEYDTVISRENALVFQSPDGKFKEQLLKDNPEDQMKALELQANGYVFAGEEEVFISEDKPIKDGPELKYIKFDNYIWSPNAKRGKRLYWEGDRFWMTVNEVIHKKKANVFLDESAEKLIKQQNGEGLSGADLVVHQRGLLFECYHWYGRFPFNKSNEIDFQDPEAIEQEVYCIIEMKEKVLLQIDFWNHSRVPYPKRVYLHGLFEETEEFWGRSLSEKLYQTQRELNTFHNTIMNNAQIAMQKIFVKKRSLTGEDWETPTVYPGAIWEEDNTGDIRALSVGEVNAIGWQLEQSFINFAERISNISLYQTGTARQTGGQKTKGEVELTVHEGNVGLDKLVQRCHNLLREICKWTVSYYAENMPPGLERRIMGEGGEPIFPTQENMQIFEEQGVEPYWKEEDLTGKFDFQWNGTRLNSSKKLQIEIANDMMDRYLPHPMIGGNLLATWEVLRDGLLSRGKKDWQKYLPPREAIVQEMQRIELESKAQHEMDRSKARVPGQAIQQAEAQGVPKEAAIQILNKMQQGGGGDAQQNQQAGQTDAQV